MVDVKKLSDYLFKDCKNRFQVSNVFFAVYDELKEKLTKEELNEFVSLFAAEHSKQEDKVGIFDISAQSNKD